MPLECSPLITSTPGTPKKNRVKRRTAKVQFAGSTFAFRAADRRATLPAHRTPGRSSQGHPHQPGPLRTPVASLPRPANPRNRHYAAPRTPALSSAPAVAAACLAAGAAGPVHRLRRCTPGRTQTTSSVSVCGGQTSKVPARISADWGIHLTGVDSGTWSSRVPARIIRGRRASSRPGSAPTRIAWITWSGCAGRAGSPARPAVVPADGGWAMGGSSVPPATGARR